MIIAALVIFFGVVIGVTFIYSSYGIYASLTYFGAIVTLIVGIVSNDADLWKPRLRTRITVIAALLLFLVGVPGYFAIFVEFQARKETDRMLEVQTAFWEEYKIKNCRMVEGSSFEIIYACDPDQIRYRVYLGRPAVPLSFVYIHQEALRERFINEGFSSEAIDGFLPTR